MHQAHKFTIENSNWASALQGDIKITVPQEDAFGMREITATTAVIEIRVSCLDRTRTLSGDVILFSTAKDFALAITWMTDSLVDRHGITKWIEPNRDECKEFFKLMFLGYSVEDCLTNTADWTKWPIIVPPHQEDNQVVLGQGQGGVAGHVVAGHGQGHGGGGVVIGHFDPGYGYHQGHFDPGYGYHQGYFDPGYGYHQGHFDPGYGYHELGAMQHPGYGYHQLGAMQHPGYYQGHPDPGYYGIPQHQPSVMWQPGYHSGVPAGAPGEGLAVGGAGGEETELPPGVTVNALGASVVLARAPGDGRALRALRHSPRGEETGGGMNSGQAHGQGRAQGR